MSLRSAVVAVGDELLLGDVVNGNAAWLGAALAGLGAPVVHSSMVGDDVELVVRALRRAMEDADVVVTSGGLGPTVDDLTRDALAAVAGVPLDRVPELERLLRERFAAFGRTVGVDVPDTVLRQADVPRGATVVDNPLGSAPGLWLEAGGTVLLALPGPPHELAATFSPVVRRAIAERSGGVVRTRTLHCAGAGESEVAALVEPVLDLPPQVRLAYLAGDGLVRVRLTTAARDADAADAVLAPHLEAAAAALGGHLWGRDDDTLAGVVLGRLRARGETVAVAESLTAGLLGAALTEPPGSSAAFRGGVQVYATDLKASLAGVPADVLVRHGAVSAETAASLASGVRARLGADWGVALTGVAGPDPQEAHPPGTVHAAVVGPGEAGAVRSLRVPGDRTRVRRLAVSAGLDLLRRRL
ncbi:MAG TPA: CinA family nicotinamide mononucleotide deamidase-related protein [Mycobacteriales bacterium]|nr:CinA family nicotinamide mononucleotide deamidase-related protein [Mycobacteriales bacterium]